MPRHPHFVLCVIASLASSGCISKGDTKIGAEDDEANQAEEGQAPCAQYCAKVEDTCGSARPNCEAECTREADECTSEYGAWLDCAIARPMGCDAVGDPYTTGCSDEDQALASCSGAAGVACGAPWDLCTESRCCADSDVWCLTSSDRLVAPEPQCLPSCSEHSECPTGCCAELDTGAKACGYPSDCYPVAVGNTCAQNSDCGSDWCAFGGCVSECETDDDCGTNFLGLRNFCWIQDGVGACLPGCYYPSDCGYFALYYKEAELSCVQWTADQGYCY